MNVSISPSTLRFSDTSLEKEYVAYSAKKDHRIHEFIFVILDGSMLIFFPFSGRAPFSWGIYIHGLIVLALHIGSLKWLKDETWVRYRFPLHLLLRFYRVWIFITLCPLPEPMDTEGFIQLFITRSGVLVNFWQALGMKTVMWQFVILQGFTVCYLAISTAQSACNMILNSPGASEEIIQLWKTVSGLLPVNLKYETYSDVQCFDMEIFQMCSSLVVLLNAHLGFAYMTFFYWLLEVRSRHQYIQEVNRNGHQLEIILETFMNPEIIANLSKLVIENANLTFFAVVGLLTVQLTWSVFLAT